MNASSKTKFVLLLDISLSGLAGIKLDHINGFNQLTVIRHQDSRTPRYLSIYVYVIYLFSKCLPEQ